MLACCVASRLFSLFDVFHYIFPLMVDYMRSPRVLLQNSYNS